ncbi:MAG: ribosome silencing factor [Burkholderiales bacterium]|nr:ribosome silencing factor [Burkholderiales bacterium]MDE2628526.1 ribosome silencing factor [Burkholderiales bacterium]
MDIRKLQRTIVDGLEDVKAQNIVVFNTEHLSALFERVIIASGTSNRQTKSLAGSVRDAVKKAGYPVPRTEGEANGEWIIVDCGAAVVHVMQPTIRDYYHLEEIWGDKPVNMKLGANTSKLVKAEDAEAPIKKVTAKKAAAKKTATKKAPAAAVPARAPTRVPAKAPAKAPARAAAKSAPTAPAKKAAATGATAARKAPAKKVAAPAGRVVTRVVGVKSTSAKLSPAVKKPAAKKPAAKKAPARTASARTPAAKTAPARKTRTRA